MFFFSGPGLRSLSLLSKINKLLAPRSTRLCARGFRSSVPVWNGLLLNASGEPLTLKTEQNGIRIVTLNNPEKRNPLSLAMMQSLYESLQIEECTRVVVIKSTGSVFSSGHDLNELSNKDEREYHEEVFSMCTKLMTHIQDLPVPVIAQVNGIAAAAGCQLVATCDLAVASQKASFSLPGGFIGLFCSTPGIAVARTMPKKVAMEMLYTGHRISADAASRYGFISRMCPEEDLERKTMNLAKQICLASRPVLSLGKKFFYEQIQMSREQAYRKGEEVMVDNLQMYDAQEGINAFIGKRKPQWTHRDDRDD